MGVFGLGVSLIKGEFACPRGVAQQILKKIREEKEIIERFYRKARPKRMVDCKVFIANSAQSRSEKEINP